MRELYEDLLGPEVDEVLSQTIHDHQTLMEPAEVEAVERKLAGQPLTERDKVGLNSLVIALSDDFMTRRRAQELQKALQPPEPVEIEDWIPDEDEERPVGPGPTGGSMEDFLAGVKLEDDTDDWIPPDREEDVPGTVEESLQQFIENLEKDEES